MMNDQANIFEDFGNPLDSIEDILAGQNWSFSRMNNDELMIDVAGRLGTYRMILLWQEEYSAMQFFCHYDMAIADDRRDIVSMALAPVNAALWLGHFDLPSETGVPRFRHTSLMRGQDQNTGADHLQDLMDIALNECERYYPMFQLLAETRGLDEGLLNLAAADSAGEA
jgi:hypothetical protein